MHSGCFYTNSSELGQLAYSKLFSSVIPIQNDLEYLEYFLFTFYISPNTLSLYNDLFVACPVVCCGVEVLIVAGDRVYDINHLKGVFVVLARYRILSDILICVHVWRLPFP